MPFRTKHIPDISSLRTKVTPAPEYDSAPRLTKDPVSLTPIQQLFCMVLPRLSKLLAMNADPKPIPIRNDRETDQE